jgi:Rrf2 family nitric oxide-sensitive transcriptional repressor
MKLTRYSDYAIRVMVHLGVRRDRLSSIAEIARAYDISENHLVKVVEGLAAAWFLEAVRGRKGGLRLNRAPEDVDLGALVRHTECGFELVDCATCPIRRACTLPSILKEATRAFLGVLDRYTVADLLTRNEEFSAILSPRAA